MLWPCYSWGATPEERLLDLPCDSLVEGAEHVYHRAVSVQASTSVVFRWLCQLRGGTYVFVSGASRRLTPGLEELAAGQSVMDAFEIVSFQHDEHLTVRTRPGSLEAKVYGEVAVSYGVISGPGQGCRLLVRTRIRYPRILGLVLRFLLPWLDLFMMRRQLLNLKRLSEHLQRDLLVESWKLSIARRRHDATVRAARARAMRRRRRLQFRRPGSRTPPA